MHRNEHASLLLEAMPFAHSSKRNLIASLLLVGAPSSVLAPRSDALCSSLSHSYLTCAGKGPYKPPNHLLLAVKESILTGCSFRRSFRKGDVLAKILNWWVETLQAQISSLGAAYGRTLKALGVLGSAMNGIWQSISQNSAMGFQAHSSNPANV